MGGGKGRLASGLGHQSGKARLYLKAKENHGRVLVFQQMSLVTAMDDEKEEIWGQRAAGSQ